MDVKSFKTVAFGGSRNFRGTKQAFELICAVYEAGAIVRVGCCVGADEYVIGTVVDSVHLAVNLQICSIFERYGYGACALSAVSAVLRAADSAWVEWRSGGGDDVPLAARLAARTKKVIDGADCFIALEPGPGTLKACAIAAKRAIPIFALAQSRPNPIPHHAGHWGPESLAGQAGWQWIPAQQSLF